MSAATLAFDSNEWLIRYAATQWLIYWGFVKIDPSELLKYNAPEYRDLLPDVPGL